MRSRCVEERGIVAAIPNSSTVVSIVKVNGDPVQAKRSRVVISCLLGGSVPMGVYRVNLHLTAQQMESYYAGHVQNVSALDVHGRRVQFPLTSLRPFVSHNGVQGHFEILVTADHRLLSIRRLTQELAS